MNLTEECLAQLHETGRVMFEIFCRVAVPARHGTEIEHYIRARDEHQTALARLQTMTEGRGK